MDHQALTLRHVLTAASTSELPDLFARLPEKPLGKELVAALKERLEDEVRA